MAVFILRIVFAVVAALLAAAFVAANLPLGAAAWVWGVAAAMILIPLVAMGLDAWLPRKRIDVVSSVFFGLVVGLLLAFVVGSTFTPLAVPEQYRGPVNLTVALVFCYVCISLLLQTRNDFRLLVPYVELARHTKRLRPSIVDTSTVIDGRIAGVAETHVFEGPLIVPRFVVAELQSIADSSDRLKRSRGRRGLDILNQLRNDPAIELIIDDRELPEFAGQPVDQKLVLLARHLEGKVITNDYNLNKVARLHGVEVVNLNDLANALKPTCLPGEPLDVQIIRPGEQPGQGVGYLEDGTMVVVEAGREHVNETVRITVTSVTQTSAGRMIFGRYESAARTGGEKPAG